MMSCRVLWKLANPDYNSELLEGLQKKIFNKWESDNWIWTPRQIVSWFGCTKRQARRAFRQMEKKGIIVNYKEWYKEQSAPS